MYQKLNLKENYVLHFDIYPACNQSSNIEAVPNHFYCCVITVLSQNITKQSFTIFFLSKHDQSDLEKNKSMNSTEFNF